MTVSASVTPAPASIGTAEAVAAVITLPQGVAADGEGVQLEAYVYYATGGTLTNTTLRFRQIPYAVWEAAGFNIPVGTVASTTYGGVAISSLPVIGPAVTPGPVTAGVAIVATDYAVDFAPLTSQGAGTQMVYALTVTNTTAAGTPATIVLSAQTNGVN